jgi:hypothetical protein
MHIIAFVAIIVDCFIVGWLESVGFRVVYDLNYKKPILYVVPIQSILGNLPLVPVGDTGTFPHRMRNAFPGAPGDRRQGAGDGCRMWFVNSTNAYFFPGWQKLLHAKWQKKSPFCSRDFSASPLK